MLELPEFVSNLDIGRPASHPRVRRECGGLRRRRRREAPGAHTVWGFAVRENTCPGAPHFRHGGLRDGVSVQGHLHHFAKPLDHMVACHAPNITVAITTDAFDASASASSWWGSTTWTAPDAAAWATTTLGGAAWATSASAAWATSAGAAWAKTTVRGQHEQVLHEQQALRGQQVLHGPQPW